MAQQNNMRPQIPAGIARSPQFAAARSITQEGLPDMLKQLLEDEITFKAMDLLEGSASEQDMDTPVNPNSIRTTNREGLMDMLGSIGPGIRQQGQQMAMAQGQGGLPSQPTSNMTEQFASGGIIGFAKGGMKDDRVKTKAYRPQPVIPVGNSNQPIPMLMQKYGGKKVLGYLEEKKALDAKAKAISEAGSAAGSMQVQDLRNMKEIFSEKYRDIISESMGMAGGGIVSFQDGGRIKRFEERVVIADEQVRAYLASLGKDIADFTAQQIAAIKETMSNTNLGASSEARAARPAQVADVVRDMLDGPVARSQNDIMSQVGRGAMGAIADAVPNTALSQGQIDAREAQLESGRGGIGAALSRGNSGPSVTDQLLAAERRREEANLTDADIRQRDKYNPAAYRQRVREAEMGKRDPSYGPQEAPVPPKEGGGLMNALRNTYGSLGRDMNPPAVSKFQQELIDAGNANVNDQLLAADQRGGGIASNLSPSMFERVLPGLRGLYTDEMRAADEAAENTTLAEGMGQLREDVGGVMPNFGNIMQRASENVGDFVDESGLAGLDYEGFARGVLPRATGVATDVASGEIAPSLGRYLGGFANDLVTGPGRLTDKILNAEFFDEMQEGYYGETPGTRSPAEVETVASIVNNAPPVETLNAPVTATNRAQLLPSDQAEVTAANLVNAENGMPAIDSFDSEVTTTDVGTGDSAELGTFLADSATGNISTASAGYQAQLDAVIARQNNPLEAISTFLRAVGEGETVSEGMQIAGKALDSLRRSNDAEQIALLKLLETGRISEQDFQLKRLQIQNEQDQIEAFESRSEFTYRASIASTLARTQSALMDQFNKTFEKIQDTDAMTAQFTSQAENFVLAGMDNKTPSKRQLKNLRNQPEFIAAVTTKTGQLIDAATKSQMANSQSTAAGMMGR